MSLPTTKATTATATHAVVQAVETYIQNQNLLGSVAELNDLLSELIDMHKDNDLALKRVVQCIYNLLLGNNRWNVKFGSKVFHKLISVVIADAPLKEDVAAQTLHRQLVANVLVCVKMHARKFPRTEGTFLLRQLWSLSQSSECQPFAAQILVQLFDDFVTEFTKPEEFVCASELHQHIQIFLQTELRDQRKSAFFLMRKLQAILQSETTDPSVGNSLHDTLQCSVLQWAAYIDIMESLEEQQSHLVLPTLNTLLPRIAAVTATTATESQQWLCWQRILYARLLKDNNILVLRWTLNYFFKHFNIEKLGRVQLLEQFLQATNRTQLYNVEGDSLAAAKLNMDKFLPESSRPVLLEALVKVNWHAVPLIFWLEQLHPKSCVNINKRLLLKLCACVRILKNPTLRQKANEHIYVLFEHTLDELRLGEYMVFVETLYSSGDHYYMDFNRWLTKMRNCTNITEELVHFNKRCFEIMVQDYALDEIVETIIGHLTNVPKSLHGWWRLFPIFMQDRLAVATKSICMNFYSNNYNVNMDLLSTGHSLAEMQQHLLHQLHCEGDEEKSFVLLHSVDCFAKVNLQQWSDMAKLNLNPLDLLEQGGRETCMHLTALLSKHNSRLEHDEHLLGTLIKQIKTLENAENAAIGIAKYAFNQLNTDEYEDVLKQLLSNRNDAMVCAILTTASRIPNAWIIHGMLEGESSTGDARIEESFAHDRAGKSCNSLYLRNIYISYVLKQRTTDMNEFLAELLRLNTELNIRKPRYFENCKEHRTKIRIARAMLMMRDCLKWTDELWSALLSPNDQHNISFMFEYLVASLLPDIQVLLLALKSRRSTLKPSQQVSMISVLHIFCIRNWQKISVNDVDEIFNLIVPLTMGAHYQTRVLAQLVLHRLAVRCEENGITSPIASSLKTCIEITLGAKLQELQNEYRLTLPEILQYDAPADVILYMTNTPFDEVILTNVPFDKLNGSIESCRAVFKAKKGFNSAEEKSPLQLANINVQRKMNPINDIFYSDLGSVELSTKHEFIVVASLIDKLANLGGLARTCEILGVRTLILGVKSSASKSDFTNLSMSAEKHLNIDEVKPNDLAAFLIEKQSAGFKVVGAEQTAHSVSFVDFKYPEKTVLLLGHEKHGIPVDLIALLDYAVEIPQFGVVRSLNVHVTGSLFIWEYCKQHMTKS
ncbi:CG18596 [Drosophila busckii]|uniref:CG18596 n=1 Tax=Drosophila busckii TaxID=30019 RepID=A0A0M4EKA5_DROBS|nr:uncharacterized protein LOC108601752 [Drosophila busckii]ALC47584.1 CG18596 [Drosophila busckii]